VARVRLRPDAPPVRPNLTELMVLVHVEVESRDSVQPFRPRMFEYYVQLRRDYQLPVLPIGVYLRVGLEGLGWDFYEEYFWEHRLLRFEYAYVGLPGLNAEDYVSGEQLLGVALSSLMGAPPERRAELHAEALKRIALSPENEWRRYLLGECVEAYGDLDEAQRQRLQALLTTEQYQDVGPLMQTTYERGRLAGQRELMVRILEAKFGPLAPAVRQRVEALTPEQLDQLALDQAQAESLNDLHLLD
jgi:hypothetical protein